MPQHSLFYTFYARFSTYPTYLRHTHSHVLNQLLSCLSPAPTQPVPPPGAKWTRPRVLLSMSPRRTHVHRTGPQATSRSQQVTQAGIYQGSREPRGQRGSAFRSISWSTLVTPSRLKPFTFPKVGETPVVNFIHKLPRETRLQWSVGNFFFQLAVGCLTCDALS